MPARDWIAFWDSKQSIYVNAHHHEAHYQCIVEDLLAFVSPGSSVLDYGCGEALAAGRIAAAAGRLVLCDAAPTVRAALETRFVSIRNIEVRAPEAVANLPAQSFDLIVMHSVAQYLSAAELDAALRLFRRLLRPDGQLVLGDVIPSDVGPLTDAMALLRFGASEGFFVAALIGLVRTAFSSYSRLRTTLGIARYDEGEVLRKLQAAGFRAQRAGKNLGHNPARMTFVAKPV